MSGLALYATVAFAGVGTVLIALGAFIIVKAIQARAEITATLLEENATTPTSGTRPQLESESSDSETSSSVIFETDVPVQPIRDARTARLRIDEITTRTVRAVGPWQSLPYEGPTRQWFLNGLTIRTALGVTVMGYGVTNIALALGAALVIIGAATLGVGIPLITQSPT
jgi:hypothetical protein